MLAVFLDPTAPKNIWLNKNLNGMTCILQSLQLAIKLHLYIWVTKSYSKFFKGQKILFCSSLVAPGQKGRKKERRTKRKIPHDNTHTHIANIRLAVVLLGLIE